MLTITHTREEGTLIDGTSRGDGTADVLKGDGWRWGRQITAWYVPQPRNRLAKLHVIERTQNALQAAGFDVGRQVDHSHRPTAVVEAGKIERQAQRVDAIEGKSDRKSAGENAAREREHAALDRLPEGGQLIHVGHHSEERHRNAIAKADTATRRAIEATAEANRAQARAYVAKYATDSRYACLRVANRVQKLSAET